MFGTNFSVLSNRHRILRVLTKIYISRIFMNNLYKQMWNSLHKIGSVIIFGPPILIVSKSTAKTACCFKNIPLLVTWSESMWSIAKVRQAHQNERATMSSPFSKQKLSLLKAKRKTPMTGTKVLKSIANKSSYNNKVWMKND